MSSANRNSTEVLMNDEEFELQKQKEREEYYRKFKQRIGAHPNSGFSQKSADYGEMLQKKWEHSKDPTNTGESWDVSKTGHGNNQASKKR